MFYKAVVSLFLISLFNVAGADLSNAQTVASVFMTTAATICVLPFGFASL